jgi:HAD superfamily hydrolase (TIGR01509 family)
MGRAVIFDMDGLLFYTEEMHCGAYINAFKTYNININPEDFYNHFTKLGTRLQDFMDMHGFRVDIDDLKNKKRVVFERMVREGLPIADGAEDVLENLYGIYPLALGTSSSRSNTDLLMDISGFGKYFDSIVTLTESKEAKPNPSCFRMISEELGADPKNFVVIEDAKKGIDAAKKLGMKTIWIPTHITKDEKAEPDLRLDCLKYVKPELIGSL